MFSRTIVTCNVNLWLRQNNQDVMNTNTRYSVNTRNNTVVLVSQAIMPLSDIIDIVKVYKKLTLMRDSVSLISQ